MGILSEKTTYSQEEEGIWRIDSGEDPADLWNFEVFEQHGKKYGGGEGEINRRREGSKEILEAQLKDREYKLLKDHDTQEFYFMFYKEAEDIENPQSYIDEIWEREIGTTLERTAQTKIKARHVLDGQDLEYIDRMLQITNRETKQT